MIKDIKFSASDEAVALGHYSAIRLCAIKLATVSQDISSQPSYGRERIIPRLIEGVPGFSAKDIAALADDLLAVPRSAAEYKAIITVIPITRNDQTVPDLRLEVIFYGARDKVRKGSPTLARFAFEFTIEARARRC